MLRSLFACATFSVVLAGCATPPSPVVRQSEVGKALDSAIRRVDAQAPYTAGPEDKPNEPAFDDGKISVVWEGEAADLLARVAKARSLDFKVYGPYPRPPLPVFVNMKGAEYDEFLRDVGHQLGQRADLVVTDSRIEIRFRGPSAL